MKKNHNKLFELIQSLTKTEKRHFSNRYASNRDSIYFKIYKALDKMKVFDIQKLEKKIGKQNLSNNITYLYNQIFSSLRNLNKDKSLYLELLDIFFAVHDPTQENGQGEDIGSQYLSAVFYLN